ncbi:hypothetical protein [Tenacibaculum maritimum]|uniref:hypothetical protein n=2 Tax=Tenacibaculum maritimum TaxID=107401 RepID=UPI001E4A1F55|nr:hypothetical protein [Tenacibaculum maritimum]MCD9586224.1 hypothetical protein [Tenacibaculum maritimum]MCD9621573.1 hypothetical protein [Tenacibaculum maritimum]MCD9627855.1 hypothetical protein [Tenacibaculum maritimum]MCD9630363.1 hypothetical protein [Tenacibaculum maritimum]MCD9636258.1 hypothetical protein [Tenacibaculum maritimum]
MSTLYSTPVNTFSQKAFWLFAYNKNAGNFVKRMPSFWSLSFNRNVGFLLFSSTVGENGC